jgi:glycosyltransferase involved in cell wall biosynthesis
VRSTGIESNRILFICHNASRIGAPLLLLTLLQWLKNNSKIEPIVLINEGGELAQKFSAIAPTYFWPANLTAKSLFARLTQTNKRRKLKKNLLRANIRLVYSNTVVNGAILHWLRLFFSGAIVTHAHELGQTVAHFGEANWQEVKTATDYFVASSSSVFRFLNSQGIRPDQIFLNPYFADMHGVPSTTRRHKSGKLFTLGSGGTIEWRKGADLFLQLAALMRRRYPKLRMQFVWVGGPTHGAEWEKIAYDLRKLKLESSVRFTDSVPDPTDYFLHMDVFALMSREEPFGMIALEAALAGTPTVCFQGAGGMADFVSGGAGVSVPYLDLDAMARKIYQLCQSAAKRQKLVQKAKQKIQRGHLLEHFGTRFLRQIKPILEGKKPE